MYLKSLEIQGFKSFADRIELDFNAGMTAVVGPNGSGKSNIGDAVRWVLGEQSAKTLRGGKMEDVIFAGTQHRKAVGFAQVSLTIDNADGALPVEFAEVTVSRRMYRSGECEYMINKVQCRLKDIHELFMNTGVGKEGYSIIGQGRIDEILSSKSDERRLVFEEAAGIMKYKVRRREAERKLESARQNLLRIEDIISELGSQLEPLEKQSESARRWLDLSGELKGIEISLSLDNLDRIAERQQEIDRQLEDVRDQIAEENKALEDIKNRNRQRTDQLERRKSQLDELRLQVAQIVSGREKGEGDVRLAEERIRNLSTANSTFGEDITGMQARLQAIGLDLEKKANRIRTLERDAVHFEAELREAEDRLAEIMSRLDTGERQVEEAKQRIMDRQDQLSDVRVHANNLKNDAENHRMRRSRLSQEILAAGFEKDRENMHKEELDGTLRKTRSEIAMASDALASAESTRDDEKRQLDALRREHADRTRMYHAAESRYKALRDLEESMEGYHHSVRAVLTRSREVPAFGKGIHGALAQLISVDAAYETAVETCLGAAMQNIVVDDEFTAKRAIEYLKETRQGRATFLPVASVRSRTLDGGTAAQVRTMPGFEAIASDSIRCDRAFGGIVENLLGRTVIVRTMDDGIRMARRFDYAFRIVTLEGELLNSGGSMTGGSLGGKSGGMLSRQRQIAELDRERIALKGQCEQLAVRISDREKAHADSEETIAALRKSLSDLELVRLRDESHLARLLDNVKKLAARQDMLRAESGDIDGTLARIGEEQKRDDEAIRAFEQEIAGLKETVSAAQNRNREEQKARDEIHADINDYRVSVNSVRESVQVLGEQAESIRLEREQMLGSMQKRDADRRSNERRIGELEAEIAGIRTRQAGLAEEQTGREMQLTAATEDVRAMEEEMSGLLEAVSSRNETLFALQEELSRQESRRAKLETEQEGIINRLWDEYGMTRGNAEPIRQDLSHLKNPQGRVQSLRSEIRALGPVNVNAIEEYTKTKERFGFMSTQRDDLVQSEEKLNRIIHEMTLVMKRQFLEQFEIINRNFSSVFRELFEGGYAEVKIADPENVLESAIDIHVQPPGKKLVNMMLLSGGERAMVAIALLFGILKMRPAPFYLLDEIEASLDDANVFKFADYIKRFTDGIQFIVITHRKGTMEASDTLYGVTMQEHGVSKVVSMRLDMTAESERAG